MSNVVLDPQEEAWGREDQRLWERGGGSGSSACQQIGAFCNLGVALLAGTAPEGQGFLGASLQTGKERLRAGDSGLSDPTEGRSELRFKSYPSQVDLWEESARCPQDGGPQEVGGAGGLLVKRGRKTLSVSHLPITESLDTPLRE